MQKKKYWLVISILALLAITAPPSIAVNLPNVPTNVTVTSASPANTLPSAGTLNVAWKRPAYDANNPIPIAYIVSAVGGGQTISTTVPMATIGTIDYSAVLTGLTGGTSYAITVTSRSSTNETAVSSPVNATPVTSPEKPGIISAVASPGSVALTWSVPTNTGGSALTGYVIKDGAGAEVTIINPATTTRTFTGLGAGSSASYSIRATNANGNSEWAAFSSVTLPSVPEKPTGITAVGGSSSITVSWVAPTINGNSAITRYKVYLYNNTGTQVGTATSATTTTIELNNISPGTYTVKVSAVNLVGESALSSSSTAVTIAQPSALLDNTPVFTPSTIPNMEISATQNIGVTVPSAGEVTITATGTPTGACTYSGGVISAVAVGTCSIRATSPATSTYAEAIGTKTFTITKTLQTITFGAISNQPLPGPLTVSATSTSALTVTFSASGNCTVNLKTVSFIGEGICTVTASQAGNSSFAEAIPVVRTFSITATVSNGSSNNNSSNNNSGGGTVPGPTPIVSPAPTPSATPTVKPTPSATAAPTPSATPTVKPTPSATPTVAPSPTTSPAPSASPAAPKPGITTKTNTFSVSSSSAVTGAIKSSTLNAAITSVTVKAGANLQPTLPAVKKGDKVSMVIKDARGKSYTVAALTISKSGSLKLPTVKFTQNGSYTITIKVGTKTKIVKVTSTK